MKKVASILKTYLIHGESDPSLFKTKMSKMDSPFMTKTDENPSLWAAYKAHIKDWYPQSSLKYRVLKI